MFAEMPMKPAEEAALFQAFPDPAFRLDAQGSVVDVNLAAQLLARGGSFVGRPLHETELKPAAAAFTAALARCRADGATAAIDCAAPAGDPVSHREVRLVPLPGDHVLVLVRDIAERKLTEEDVLRRTDAKLRVLADHLTDVFWIRSPDMRELRYVSPAFERIWGRPVSTLYNSPHRWVDFIVPEDREHVVKTFAGLTADSRNLDVEYRIERPDGERRWVRVRGFQVRDAEDRLICNTGIVTDTTERKLAQAELDAAHKQLLEASRRAGMAEIATNVLHNVGNILNSVTVSAGLLRDALRTSRAHGLRRAVQMLEAHKGALGSFLTDDEKGRLLPGYIGEISQALLQEQQQMIEELNHLTRSIDHIREVVAMQQSYARSAGSVAPARLDDLVDDAVRMNSDGLARDRVIVVRELDAVPGAMLDRGRMLPILVNLIGNAREALRGVPAHARRITVRAVVAGDNRLRLSVRDEGEGIPEASLSRIFAHGFTTRKHGHGFGLHSCAQSAAELRGTLTVHSDGPGRGATFTLDVPFEPVAPP